MKITVVFFLLLVVPVVVCAQVVQQQDQISGSSSAVMEARELTACEKAGGKIIKIKECDGSESSWCVISERQQCYADQVKDDRCSVGEYSEELGGIVGITPRVICDGGDFQ